MKTISGRIRCDAACRYVILVIAAVLLAVGCGRVQSQDRTDGARETGNGQTARATFAGGCFWCMEPPFEKLDGVHAVISGYTGGHVKDPTYRQVSSGGTGHLEVVQVRYNPSEVSYKKLLSIFWRQINPTDDGGQFVDRGHQYTTRIFYHSERQKTLAETSRTRLENAGVFEAPIVTEISPAETFYRAEAYHQDYYRKKPRRYSNYRQASGRDQFLQSAWSGHEEFTFFPENESTTSTSRSTSRQHMYETPSESNLKERLTDLQYRVTQQDGTEPPYDNRYWDNKEPGIYVDVVSGEPLFSSTHKFKSGTGWPSFYKPLVEDHIVTKPDHSTGTVRTEVRSKHGDSHLGHVFRDGPEPTGKRYCINSAALEFIPADQLDERGYERFVHLFESTAGSSDDE